MQYISIPYNAIFAHTPSTGIAADDAIGLPIS